MSDSSLVLLTNKLAETRFCEMLDKVMQETNNEMVIDFLKDKFDNQVNKPIDDFNHLLDAMRYAMERFGRKGSGIQFLI